MSEPRTPGGQAALAKHRELKLLNARDRGAYWDAIALAAIEATREDVSVDEREHCENVVGQLADAEGLVVITTSVVALVEFQRAAAHAQGRAEGEAVWHAAEKAELKTLQAKHQALVAAAEDAALFLECVDSWETENEPEDHEAECWRVAQKIRALLKKNEP